MKRALMITALLLFTSCVFAESNSTDQVAASQYLEKQPGITPQYYQCGTYTSWFTSTSYCRQNAASCADCLRPLDGRYEDQYQYRICRDTVTGERTREYRFRNIVTGCCSRCRF